MRLLAPLMLLALAACGSTSRPDPEAVLRGQKAFATCAACHSVKGAAGVGPPLNGIIDRKAAAWPGYAYSPALRGSGLVWDQETLVRFLTKPDSIPGINMVITPLTEAQARDVVAYLASL